MNQDLTHTDDDFFDRLAEADDALAGGSQADTAIVGEVTPDLHPRLQRNLGALNLLQRLRPPKPDGSRRLGRFIIERELGRGGFGVVFLAEDPHLGRQVALKVPRADALIDEQFRARFHTEARAAARLDHPNIVAVYEAGDIGPVAYIASAYCPGPDLATWLRDHREPLPWQSCAELIATLANAVHEAHRQGVLHRDLKPANVLLSPESRVLSAEEDYPDLRGTQDSELRTLHPKITDFGLARIEGSDQTQTHQLLGTPHYMSPEQASEGTVGPATDIWALGAILYECLTGQPPFRGSSTMETLDLIRSEEVVPPERLRPRLPRDVSTVCLKCLNKEPGRRYATAEDLAMDLRRVLDDRPPLARRATRRERAWRWCRRNPFSAGLALALVLALTVGVGGILWQWQRANTLAEQNGRERDKAQAHLTKARAAVEQLSALSDKLANRPGLDSTRRKVYETVLQYHLGFLTENGADPAMRQEAARAWHRVGLMRLRFGDIQGAVAAFTEQANLLEQFLAAEPGHRAHRQSLAWCRLDRGITLRRTDRDAEAEADTREAIRLSETLAAEDSTDVTCRDSLAISLTNLGSLVAADRPVLAEQSWVRAVAIQRQISSRFDLDSKFWYNFAIALLDLGELRGRQGRFGEADSLFDEAATICRRQVEARPDNADYRALLARTSYRRSLAHEKAGRLQDAEACAREGLATLKQLMTENAGVLDDPVAYVDTQFRLAYLLWNQDRLAESLPFAEGALAAQRQLARDAPSAPEVQARLRNCYTLVARTLAWLGRESEGLALYPDVAKVQGESEYADIIFAQLLSMATEVKQRQPAEAVRLAEQALKASPNNANYWNVLAAARYAAGDYTKALEAADRAAALRDKPAEIDGFVRTLCHAKLGQTAKARAQLAEAESLMPKPPAEDWYILRLRAEATAAVKGDK